MNLTFRASAEPPSQTGNKFMVVAAWRDIPGAPVASAAGGMPRLRSPKEPFFSFRYWLSRLQVWEKVDFSSGLAGGLLPPAKEPDSECSDEIDMLPSGRQLENQ